MKKIFIISIICVLGCNNEQKSNKENNEPVTMTQDPHSFAQPDQAIVKHLDWTATVNFETKTIAAKAKLDIQTATDAEELILDTKGLNISEVVVDGEKVSYTLGEEREHMGQPLLIPVTPTTREVTVNYSTSAGSEALQWLEPVQTAGKKYPFLFTQSQAILARSWVPVQDSPGIRFTYTAQVTVPSELIALMSAENPTEKNTDGVYRFEMRQPIPAYLLALAVGDVEFQAVGEQTGVYAEPSVLDKAVYEFADMQKMLEAAEELYGPYRWERYDVIVLPPSFPFGGMENPRLTFATPTILAGDRSLVSLVAHELAHSWSGNLVTNATWNDFWLNEGFTVYFEYRIMEAVYGSDYSEMLAALSLQSLENEVEEMIENGNSRDTHLKLELVGRNPDDGVTTIAYDKGYFFLRNIEEMVGRETFDAFLRKYFDENAFQTMTTESFLEYLTNNLFIPNNMEGYTELYQQWIYAPGLPENHPVPESDRFQVVEKAVDKWTGGMAASELGTDSWTTHEWLHFLNNLPDKLSEEQLKALDEAFSFSQSGNSEILGAWFVIASANNYQPAFAAMENFLVETGRRKFLTPIYKELAKTASGLALAKDIYAKARPNYHFVSTNTIDEILDWGQNKTEN